MKGKYGYKFGLEKLQDIRCTSGDPEEVKEAQKDIDELFFGAPKKQKSRKDRRRERRKERQKMREEEY